MEGLQSATTSNTLGMVTFLVAFSFIKIQAQNAIKDSIPYIDPQTFFALLEIKYPDLYTSKDGHETYTIIPNNSNIAQPTETVKTKRQKKILKRRKKRLKQ